MKKNKDTSNTVVKQSRGKEIWRLLRKNKPAMFGLALFLIILLIAIFADVIVDEEMCYKISGRPLQEPSSEHWFGTDNIGRDLFARIIHGSRVSLLVGIGATVLSLLVGAFIGAACGYFGGWLDNVVMRIFDVISSIPGMLLILVLVMALGVGTENLIYALLISGVPGYARFVRSTVINLTDMDYVLCAKSYRTSNFKIVLKHVLPNALGPIIILLAGSIAGTIIAAASYSFLGFGVQAPTPEWGAIVSSSKDYMRLSPYYTIIPGLSIVLTAMSINLVGDGLRDALDPRLKD
ncbi:MAG: ABC transporter permease [Oscillospiraceae bacterium]|nr:ABC transporter permease [Oscillospiraceae bacterium]